MDGPNPSTWDEGLKVVQTRELTPHSTPYVEAKAGQYVLFTHALPASLCDRRDIFKELFQLRSLAVGVRPLSKAIMKLNRRTELPFERLLFCVEEKQWPDLKDAVESAQVVDREFRCYLPVWYRVRFEELPDDLHKLSPDVWIAGAATARHTLVPVVLDGRFVEFVPNDTVTEQVVMAKMLEDKRLELQERLRDQLKQN